MIFSETAHNIKRYTDIARLVWKYGGSDVIRSIEAERLVDQEITLDSDTAAKAKDLPDDLERVANWVEFLTGSTLDESGSIQPLDNAAWLERREEVIRQGGPPVPDAGR